MPELILGGARSGKTGLAQQRAEASGLVVTYVATATAGDAEMAERIERHQADRPAEWRLVEEPVGLGRILRENTAPGACLLVDCLTLWLSNTLGSGDEALFERERGDLMAALEAAAGAVILVSNEVGQGVVPAHPVSRRFVDEAGRLHQEVAARCDRVTFVTAGLPMTLKGDPA